MSKFILALTMLMLITQPTYLFPQSSGHSAGMTFGISQVYNDVHFSYILCERMSLEDFSGQTLFYGLSYENLIFQDAGFSLLTRLYYHDFNFMIYIEGPTYSGFDPYEELPDTKTRFDHEAGYSYLNLDILPKIKIPFVNIGFFAGVSLNYLTQSNYRVIYRITEPDYVKWGYSPYLVDSLGCKYVDSNRAIEFYNSEIPYHDDLRFAIKLGLDYDFTISNFTLTPFISVDYSLTPLIYDYEKKYSGIECSDPAQYNDLHWNLQFFQAGLDLKYCFP